MTAALFSADRHYRYVLTRELVTPLLRDLHALEQPSLGRINFIMLNPSTADEVQNDPTVERCVIRAKRLGYRQLVVTNLFALRSTDPEVLYTAEDPVGPENDHHLLEQAQAADLVICAWGNHGLFKNRGKSVAERLYRAAIPLYCLGTTKGGEPSHPLYLSYEHAPQVWLAP